VSISLLMSVLCVPIQQINIACPTNGTQKVIEIDDEKRLRLLYDKRISQEVNGEDLGEAFNGYVSVVPLFASCAFMRL
jgi:ribosomal protein S6E (S10)